MKNIKNKQSRRSQSDILYEYYLSLEPSPKERSNKKRIRQVVNAADDIQRQMEIMGVLIRFQLKNYMNQK